MISLDKVSLSLDGHVILSNIHLRLVERRIGIIGPNGSGKSSLARLLNGLQLPTQGTVTVDGLDTRGHRKAVLSLVGFVFQNPDNQIVYPTVAEDLAFGLKNSGMSKAELNERVQNILRLYGLEALASRLTHCLSGGEKQMLALLGVMVMQPAYIVLDEPTTLLDLRNKRRIMQTLDCLEEKIVLVTHDLDLIKNYDRVIYMEQGRIQMDGPPDLVIKQYKKLCQI